jgi:hypothetical protein
MYDPDNPTKIENMTDQQLDDEFTDVELYIDEMEAQLKVSRQRSQRIIVEMACREIKQSKMENMLKL